MAESTQLGIYILSTAKSTHLFPALDLPAYLVRTTQNVAALKQAEEAQMVASLVLSYRSIAAARPEQQSLLQLLQT